MRHLAIGHATVANRVHVDLQTPASARAQAQRSLFILPSKCNVYEAASSPLALSARTAALPPSSITATSHMCVDLKSQLASSMCRPSMRTASWARIDTWYSIRLCLILDELTHGRRYFMKGETELDVTVTVVEKMGEAVSHSWELYVSFPTVMFVWSDRPADTTAVTGSRLIPTSSATQASWQPVTIQHNFAHRIRSLTSRMKACRLASATGSIYHVHKYDPSSRVHSLRASHDASVDGRPRHIYTQHLRRRHTGRLFSFTGDRRSDSITASQPAYTLSSPVLHHVLVPLLDPRTHGPRRERAQRHRAGRRRTWSSSGPSAVAATGLHPVK